MIRFPPLEQAAPSGLLCISDTMTPELLWSAYRQGVFPWTDEPVGWFSPPQRAILIPQDAHFPRNLRRLWKKARFEVTLDTCFEEVIRLCQHVHRHEGEWITERFVQTYTELFQAGRAHSVELWQDDVLIGGTYGVLTGRIFSAESMFGCVNNASRSALYALVRLATRLRIDCIDVQILGDVTQRLGAVVVSRDDFLFRLQQGMATADALAPCRWPLQPFGSLAGDAP